MRVIQRYLILGVASIFAPIAIANAPMANADCNYAAGATVCAQGEVRGADGVPRAATPYVPYPCEYDWSCGVEWDINWDPGPNRPGGPGGPGRPGGGGGIGPRR